MKLILASGSPRRRELMNMITDDFIVAVTDADELLPDDIGAFEAAEFLAEKKARAAAVSYPDDIVIGCDTIVVLGESVLGKPEDREDAAFMLRALSGRTHKVITGTAIVCRGIVTSFSEVTDVTFYPLSDEEIETYLDTGEPFDKAGAYGIQGKGCLLVKEIKGDYFSVVGMPVARLKRKLDEIKEN